jgi:ribose transport system permease protein
MVESAGARFGRWLERNPTVFAVIAFLLICLGMVFVSDRFFSWENITNVVRQVSINGIISVGMTLVILTGGIDLSVGAVMALSMTLSAGAMISGVPMPVAVLIGLLTGAACGALNGLLIAYGRLPAIIVTLGMMEIPRGIALLYTGGYPQNGLPESFAVFGRGALLGIQVPVLIMLGTFGAAFVLLKYFPTGRYLFGIGGNEEALRLSGVRVKRYKFLAYVLSGLTAAISGIVLESRLMSGQPNAGIGFELDAIAAVVLGGTSIAGGRGSIVGTLIGALTLGVLNNGLNLMGVSPYTQKILKGAIIILSVLASTWRRRDRNGSSN